MAHHTPHPTLSPPVPKTTSLVAVEPHRVHLSTVVASSPVACRASSPHHLLTVEPHRLLPLPVDRGSSLRPSVEPPLSAAMAPATLVLGFSLYHLDSQPHWSAATALLASSYCLPTSSTVAAESYAGYRLQQSRPPTATASSLKPAAASVSCLGQPIGPSSFLGLARQYTRVIVPCLGQQ